MGLHTAPTTPTPCRQNSLSSDVTWPVRGVVVAALSSKAVKPSPFLISALMTPYRRALRFTSQLSCFPFSHTFTIV